MSIPCPMKMLLEPVVDFVPDPMKMLEEPCPGLPEFMPIEMIFDAFRLSAPE